MRSAAVVGRIPLTDVADRRVHTGAPLAFTTPKRQICWGTFVDNLFPTGPESSSAVAILQDAEIALAQRWRLVFGADSKQVVPAIGADDAADIAGWTVLDGMRCLGHNLSGSSTISKDFMDTVRKVWAAYWRNSSKALKTSSTRAKAKFMNNSLVPIASFRWSRWPWQKAYASRLDSLQRHVISCLCPTCPAPGEDISAYTRRRSAASSRLATEWGRWSQLWAKDVLKWDQHISRAHDPGTWNEPLRQWHGKKWLHKQRFEHSTGGTFGRTRTRASPGHPATRWEEGVALAAAVAA